MRPSALVLAVAACSVPGISLEGKQCPCDESAGYVCDPLTQRCLMTNDAGEIIDSPAATQCLPSPPGETLLYRYAGMFDTLWVTSGGTWSGTMTEIRQSATNAQDAYAYTTSSELTASPNVRVLATMRTVQVGNGQPNLGIVLRAQPSPQDKSRYNCRWSAKDRTLRLEAQLAGNANVIDSVTIEGSVTLPSSLTMEAAVDGTTVACCIREIAGASVTATDTTTAQGYPGLTASRMDAAFGSFVVFQRP